MKEQRVVRTYPPGYTNTNEKLRSLLSEGFYVVECHPVLDGILEYVVERNIEEPK